MASEISHPSVCRIYGLEEQGGDRLCVMELLEGETLSERLASHGAFSSSEALPVVLRGPWAEASDHSSASVL